MLAMTRNIETKARQQIGPEPYSSGGYIRNKPYSAHSSPPTKATTSSLNARSSKPAFIWRA